LLKNKANVTVLMAQELKSAPNTKATQNGISIINDRLIVYNGPALEGENGEIFLKKVKRG